MSADRKYRLPKFKNMTVEQMYADPYLHKDIKKILMRGNYVSSVVLSDDDDEKTVRKQPKPKEVIVVDDDDDDVNIAPRLSSLTAPDYVSNFGHFFYDSAKYPNFRQRIERYRADRQVDRREQIFFVRTFGKFLDDDNPDFILRKFNGRDYKAKVRLLDTGQLRRLQFCTTKQTNADFAFYHLCLWQLFDLRFQLRNKDIPRHATTRKTRVVAARFLD